MRLRKKWLFVLAVLAVGGMTWGYFLYNKPHQNIASADAIGVTAPQLYAAFTQDSVQANAKFAQRVVEVSGVVTNVSRNLDQQSVVLLESGQDGASVNCTLDGADETIKVGQSVSIKALCSGIGQGDAEMGIPADVYLVRGVLQASK